MKNTFIAVAAALACSGAAYAQSNVQLTGLVDMYVGSMKAPGGERAGAVGSGGLTTSWWGLKGTEDLGNGLKADFNLTAFFRADTGTPGRYDLAFGETFFARDANVGLSGSFGRVGLGRGMAPNFLPTILTNPFGDSFTISPLVLHANMSTGMSPVVWDKDINGTTGTDTGWSNQIVYSTPNMGGLKANVHYQFGEQTAAGQRGKKNVGVNALYGAGPLSLAAFYERVQISGPQGLQVQDSKTDWMLGGTYDFSVVKLYGTYGQAKIKTLDVKNTTYSLGLDVPVSSAGTIKAAGAHTKSEVGAVEGKRTTYTVGYDHFLSKRTDVYGAVMYDRVKWAESKSGTSVAVGIRHRF